MKIINCILIVFILLILCSCDDTFEDNEVCFEVKGKQTTGGFFQPQYSTSIVIDTEDNMYDLVCNSHKINEFKTGSFVCVRSDNGKSPIESGRICSWRVVSK